MNISVELQKFRFEIINLNRRPVIESIKSLISRISPPFRMPSKYQYFHKLSTSLNSLLVEWLIRKINQSPNQPINDICTMSFRVRLLLRDNSAFNLFQTSRTFGAPGIKDNQGFQRFIANRFAGMGNTRIKIYAVAFVKGSMCLFGYGLARAS